MDQWSYDHCEYLASKVEVVQGQIAKEVGVIVLRTGWSRDFIFSKIYEYERSREKE